MIETEKFRRDFLFMYVFWCRAFLDLGSPMFQELLHNLTAAPLSRFLRHEVEWLHQSVGLEGLLTIDEAVDVVAKLQSNAWELTQVPAGLHFLRRDAAQLPALMTNGLVGTAGYGIFPRASMLNHSCVPNVDVVIDGDRLVVRTFLDIQENEELLCTYVDTECPWSERRTKLLDVYGFDCQCTLCLLQGEAKVTSESGLTVCGLHLGEICARTSQLSAWRHKAYHGGPQQQQVTCEWDELRSRHIDRASTVGASCEELERLEKAFARK